MLYDKIKDACIKKSISIASVEKELGFSNGSISKWNESEPSASKLCMVAKFLETTSESLLKEELAKGRN